MVKVRGEMGGGGGRGYGEVYKGERGDVWGC